MSTLVKSSNLDDTIAVNNFIITTTLTANGSLGSNTFVLTSNGAGAYWSSPAAGASVTLDAFVGDNATLTWPLSSSPTNDAYVFPYINGILQHETQYTAAGNTIVFTNAPPLGANVEVRVLQAAATAVIVPKTLINVAAATFTGLSPYKNFRIVFDSIVPVLNGDQLRVNFSSDGGTTWGTSYLMNGSTAATSYISLATGVSNTPSRNGVNGTVEVFGFNTVTETQSFNRLTWPDSNPVPARQSTAGATFVNGAGSRYTVATAMNAVKVYFASGNIASGIIRLEAVV